MVKQTAMAIENLDRCVVDEGHRDDMGRLSVVKWCRCRLGADTGGQSHFMVVWSFVFQRILLMERSLTSSRLQFGH